jgi:hypothetical protein
VPRLLVQLAAVSHAVPAPPPPLHPKVAARAEGRRAGSARPSRTVRVGNRELFRVFMI